MDLIILNHGQNTKTTSDLAVSSVHTTSNGGQSHGISPSSRIIQVLLFENDRAAHKNLGSRVVMVTKSWPSRFKGRVLVSQETRHVDR
ncbi:hypothetical protein TNCV_4107791 [Trichonephila clavipes]|nr:hypothetical protein TNCV_4107791 [Trichonephila clavipes]